jgi:hypothetical protein
MDGHARLFIPIRSLFRVFSDPLRDFRSAPGQAATVAESNLNGDDAMTAEDIVGYWASTMVFLTFVTKDMRLLRVLALISNVAFLSYGLLAWLPPVFCLHLVLMPINAIRLGQILQAKGYHASVHWLATRVPQFYPAHQGPGRLVA